MKSLFLIGASAASLAAFAAEEAAAQSAINPIDHCRDTTETDKERIACLEAAITGLMSAGGRQSAETEADETEDGRIAVDDAETNDYQSEETRFAADKAEEEVSLAEAESEPAPTGLGAEQVIARRERETEEGRVRRSERTEAETIRAGIADFAHTATGLLIIVLDNGQVWSQIKGDNQSLNLSDDDKYTAEISSGFLSGYKLRIIEERRTIRVQRLQ